MFWIAVLDDEITELHKTSEMLSLYEKMHPEYELKISCYTEMKLFMEAVCGREGQVVQDFDILFMDICLPDGNGVEGAQILREKGFHGSIVFKSSSREYALEAYSVGALQYLVKPVSKEKLFRALDRAIEKSVKDSQSYPVFRTEEEKTRKSVRGLLRGWFKRK